MHADQRRQGDGRKCTPRGRHQRRKHNDHDHRNGEAQSDQRRAEFEPQDRTPLPASATTIANQRMCATSNRGSVSAAANPALSVDSSFGVTANSTMPSLSTGTGVEVPEKT